MVNWCYLASNQVAGKLILIICVECTDNVAMIVAGITCNSQSQIMKNPRLGMKKRLGSVFEFRCKSKCNGSFSFFHHNHTTEKFDLIFQSPNDTYNIPLLSFDDGGEYCCSEQCNNKSTTPDMPDCCTRIKSKKPASRIYISICTCMLFVYSFACSGMDFTKSRWPSWIPYPWQLQCHCLPQASS